MRSLFSKYCPAGCLTSAQEISGTIPNGYREVSVYSMYMYTNCRCFLFFHLQHHVSGRVMAPSGLLRARPPPQTNTSSLFAKSYFHNLCFIICLIHGNALSLHIFQFDSVRAFFFMSCVTPPMVCKSWADDLTAPPLCVRSWVQSLWLMTSCSELEVSL